MTAAIIATPFFLLALVCAVSLAWSRMSRTAPLSNARPFGCALCHCAFRGVMCLSRHYRVQHPGAFDVDRWRE